MNTAFSATCFQMLYAFLFKVYILEMAYNWVFNFYRFCPLLFSNIVIDMVRFKVYHFIMCFLYVLSELVFMFLYAFFWIIELFTLFFGFLAIALHIISVIIVPVSNIIHSTQLTFYYFT